MNDIVYYAARGRTYLEIIKGILVFLIWMVPLFILGYVQKAQFVTQFVIEHLFGFLFISALLSISYLERAYASMYHPIVRITEDYLIMNFDRAVWPWDYIERVKIIGSTIRLTKKKEKWLWNETSERLSYVPDRKELVQKLMEYCEKKGIPCEAEYLDQL